MKGNPEVIVYLQEVLTAELTAINQYFLHAEMCANWGYERLYKYARKESIEEMKHAELCIERLLFLEGSPNVGDMFKLRIGRNVKEQMENDLALEIEAVARLNKAIAKSVEVGDNSSRDLFESILTEEEEHVDYLEAQLHMMEEIGVEKYLSQHIHKEE